MALSFKMCGFDNVSGCMRAFPGCTTSWLSHAPRSHNSTQELLASHADDVRGVKVQITASFSSTIMSTIIWFGPDGGIGPLSPLCCLIVRCRSPPEMSSPVWSPASNGPGAVTMSAVARDSPEVMGEAADTPHCPPLQRGWLGEAQLGSLTRHKCWRAGVEPGPPLVLPLHPSCIEQQHTARPFSGSLVGYWS